MRILGVSLIPYLILFFVGCERGQNIKEFGISKDAKDVSSNTLMTQKNMKIDGLDENVLFFPPITEDVVQGIPSPSIGVFIPIVNVYYLPSYLYSVSAYQRNLIDNGFDNN